MDYISEIIVAINKLHDCAANHVQTVPVKEVFKGQTVWEGDVEVFNLINHPKAKKAYAWGYAPDRNSPMTITTVLEIPPVVSPVTAVRAAIAAQGRK